MAPRGPDGDPPGGGPPDRDSDRPGGSDPSRPSDDPGPVGRQDHRADGGFAGQSGSPEPLRATQVDWDAVEAGRTWPSVPAVGLVATLGALCVWYAYTRVALPPNAPVLLGWQFRPTDWLFLAAVAVGCWTVGYRAVTDPAAVGRVWRRLREDRVATAAAAYLAAFALVGGVGPALLGPADTSPLHGFQPPVGFGISTVFLSNCVGRVVDGVCHGSLAYPLGSTPHGKGMTRVAVLGARAALELAVVSAAIIVPLGTLVGVVAGYYGGRVDWALTRYLDVQGTVPAFVVYLVAIFVFGRSLFLIVVVFGLLAWDGVARVVRREARRLREEEFVLAARSAGASRLSVVRRHVLPNVSDTVVVATARRVPVLILTEAAISFLELNDIMVPTWGETIRRGMNDLFPVMWWISSIPVVLLTLTAVSFIVLGDSLRDVLNPTGN